MTVTKFLTSNPVLYAIILFLFFMIVQTLFDLDNLIAGFNGVFIGTMLSVTVAYGPLFWKAMVGDQSVHPDARQLAIGYFMAWAAYGMVVVASAYIRMADLSPTPLLLTAISRYIAIAAAITQITAADYGKGLFYGRDRKVLWYAGGVGLVAAVAVTIAQTSSALAIGVL